MVVDVQVLKALCDRWATEAAGAANRAHRDGDKDLFHFFDGEANAYKAVAEHFTNSKDKQGD